MADTSTTSAAASMYAVKEKIHPREVSGFFTRLRYTAVWALLGIYYLTPWLQWNGHQAILFDLPARKFHIFSLTFWPQDFYFLAWLLIMAAITLFFVTALAGRVWCGFVCPQTVWTEAFVWMERITEGKRPQRIKLDKAPWNMEKLARKSAKQILWLSFAAFTGFTFVGYFTPVIELGRHLATFSLGPWESFWILFYGFSTYGNAGFMREQVCKYMCPYARFQSAMFDRDTLIISYDESRGEPRGKRKKGSDQRAAGLGDCINCTLCVQVCPTGIDIRQGLQYECIACAACIDVCDDVMDKMKYPRGLIRYSTENAMQGKQGHVLRSRTAVYAVMLTALLSGFLWSIGQRNLIGLDVLRDRNALYRQVAGQMIENVYTLKIINKDNKAHRFELSADGLPGIRLDIESPFIEVNGGEIRAIALRVRVPAIQISEQRNNIRIRLVSRDDPELSVDRTTRFFGPATAQ